MVRAGVAGWRYRVVAVTAPRLAAAQPSQAQPGAAHGTMGLQGLDGVGRARRRVAARGRSAGTGVLIPTDRCHQSSGPPSGGASSPRIVRSLERTVAIDTAIIDTAIIDTVTIDAVRRTHHFERSSASSASAVEMDSTPDECAEAVDEVESSSRRCNARSSEPRRLVMAAPAASGRTMTRWARGAKRPSWSSSADA